MKKLLSRVVSHTFPGWYRRYQHGKRARLYAGKSREEVFGIIHRQNLWASPETVSGHGSTLAETQPIRQALPALVRELGIRSVLDVPCGDFHWMRELAPLFESYKGGDIVLQLVEANRAKFGSDKVEFLHLDVVSSPLPAVDLVIVRDCLVHLSLAEAAAALQNIARSGSTWMLATHFEGIQNEEAITGEWRPLNLCGAPFGLPAPDRLLADSASHAGKTLGLWRLGPMGA
jgi:SAM-dependent methyltransferase